MANPSPNDVEICPSRSSMASTYGASTAPISTRRSPDWRTASNLSEARNPRRTASWARSSLIGSSFEGTSFFDRVDEPVERWVAQEHLEGHDHPVGSDTAGGGLQTAVDDDD